MSVIERVKSEQTVDVFQTVKLIRAKRPGAVLTLVSCYLVYPREVDLRERFPGPYDNFVKSFISCVPSSYRPSEKKSLLHESLYQIAPPLKGQYIDPLTIIFRSIQSH